MCQFIDDGESVFGFSQLQRCMVDQLGGVGRLEAVFAAPVRQSPGVAGL
jgi:hypothetical protein